MNAMTSLAVEACSAGEPMSWWQALLATAACFALGAALFALVLWGRR